MNEEENTMKETADANDENAEGLFSEEETSTDGDEEEMFEDERVQIGTQPVAVAASIVKTCLTQLCKF